MQDEVRIYDIYASILNYKKSVDVLSRPFVSESWVPENHLRRLKAYEIFNAFFQNYSRDFRMPPETGDLSQNDEIFEMGDPAFLCSTIKSKLLGDSFTISMPGKKSFSPEIKELILKREEYLKDWFTNEENPIYTLIDENELTCSYLGDMVYMVQYNAEAQRPEIITYDPGFYFGDYDYNNASLQEGVSDLVKDRIIIAWQEEDPTDSKKLRIWRDIYELRVKGTGDKEVWNYSGYFEYTGNKEQDIYNLDDKDLIVDQYSLGTKEWKKLSINFLPFVHVPNIKLQGEKYGISNLHFHLAMIDKIINTFTDLSKNCESLGGATVFTWGKDIALVRDQITKEPIPIKIEPNTVYHLGESGGAQILDNSSMQNALLETIKVLEAKLIRNSKITDVGAGLASTQIELSGIALKMLLQPLLDMITPMRNQREKYYVKLFWMVQKMYQIYGLPEEKSLFSGDLYPVKIVFGKLVPDDEAAKLDEYLKLKGLIGEKATLEKMKKDGYDIDVEAILQQMELERKRSIEEQMDVFSMRRKNDSSFEGDEQ